MVAYFFHYFSLKKLRFCYQLFISNFRFENAGIALKLCDGQDG